MSFEKKNDTKSLIFKKKNLALKMVKLSCYCMLGSNFSRIYQFFLKTAPSAPKFARFAHKILPPIRKYWKGRIRGLGRIGGGAAPNAPLIGHPCPHAPLIGRPCPSQQNFGPLKNGSPVFWEIQEAYFWTVFEKQIIFFETYLKQPSQLALIEF